MGRSGIRRVMSCDTRARSASCTAHTCMFKTSSKGGREKAAAHKQEDGTKYRYIRAAFYLLQWGMSEEIMLIHLYGLSVKNKENKIHAGRTRGIEYLLYGLGVGVNSYSPLLDKAQQKRAPREKHKEEDTE